MITKIDSSNLKGKGPIKVLFPGLFTEDKVDTGIASIGRIDHSFFEGDNLIPMHPHINDEIVTYMRSGHLEHIDSEGYHKELDPNTWMLMKAGKLFQHEEKIVDKGQPLEALQIFIRPGKKDLQPEVVFKVLNSLYSENRWRNIAAPANQDGFVFSSETWIYDTRLTKRSTMGLPIEIDANKTALLYVFNGEVVINDEESLKKKDSLIIEDENITIKANQLSDLVLFITDKDKPFYDGGMFSGNRNK